MLFIRLLSILGFCCLKALPPAFLVIAAAYINPLNLTASSDRASQDVFFRYMAPLYGEKNQPITIIVLDDEYLVRTDSSWPIPYRTLTKFLQTIYCVEPKAIFIDLVFTHLHSSQNSLDRFVGHLNPGVHPETVREIVDDCQSFDNGDYGGSIAPVFIADFAPQKDFAVEDGSVVLPAMRHGGVRRLPTNWVADHGVYPLVIHLDQGAASRIEPDCADENGEEACIDKREAALGGLWPESVDLKVASPALALYSALQDGADDPDLDTLIEAEDNELIVEWGFYPRHLLNEAMPADDDEGRSKVRIRYFPERCKIKPESEWLRRAESVHQFMMDGFGILNQNPGEPRQPCPYNQWVPAEAVLYAREPAQKKTLRDLLQDRVVMIGADIRGAPDLVQSPVHGQVPGVFLHAMALDNLLELERDGYWRPMPSFPGFLAPLSPMKVIESLLLVALLTVSTGVSRWRKHAGERWHRLAFPMVELGGHISLVFGTILVLAALAIAPFNWLGLLGIAIGKDVLQQLRLPGPDPQIIVRTRS